MSFIVKGDSLLFTESFLNQKAKFYAQYLWNKELNIPIKINKRLKSTLGQYCHTHIDIAPHILDQELLTEDTLLHELCHWYCHTSGLKWDDHTKDFEDELKRIGASSTFTTQFTNGKLMYLYRYGCYKCKTCNRELQTNEYCDERVDGQIGTPIKKYNCCDNTMNFSGVRVVREIFQGNEKIHKLREAFQKSIEEVVVV